MQKRMNTRMKRATAPAERLLVAGPELGSLLATHLLCLRALHSTACRHCLWNLGRQLGLAETRRYWNWVFPEEHSRAECLLDQELS